MITNITQHRTATITKNLVRLWLIQHTISHNNGQAMGLLFWGLRKLASQLSLSNYMMTSSKGSIFRGTGPLCGDFTDPGEFHTQRPVTRSFDVFLDVRLNKRLSKQRWGWWFETPSSSLWRQCNVVSLPTEISHGRNMLKGNDLSYHKSPECWAGWNKSWYPHLWSGHIVIRCVLVQSTN